MHAAVLCFVSGSDLSRPIWVQLSICAVSDGRPRGTLPVSRSANIIFVVYLHMGYDDMSIVAQLSHWGTSRCGDGGR